MSKHISENAVSRRMVLGGLASLVTVAAAAPSFASAPAVLRGAGDFRSIAFVNNRTGEWLKTVYWADGDYIPEALSAVDHILRDWREDEERRMDRQVIDILCSAQKLLECSDPFEVVSGYRTPKTNALLRKRSKGVAAKSYHIKGMAVDVRMKNRSVAQISKAGLALGKGGVGRYSGSGFVHLDSGPVRDWGS